MGDSENFDDMLNDEDLDEEFSDLEDNPGEDESSSIIPGEGMEAVTADMPVYRLRLVYSNETFLAAWTGDILSPGSMVLVPTRYGRDVAQIIGPIQRDNSAPGEGGCPNHVQPLSEIVRIERPATAEDLEKIKSYEELEKSAFAICKEKIEAHHLDMKLVSVHYLLDEPKIIFFFTADNRVDFRELVKDLLGVFKPKIVLRQIGVRDESRVVGGLGVCGRCYCCHSVSDKLKPVSIKMAKDQNLSLNSMKISGPCGRLLCCLAYEHLFYGEQRRIIPPEGARISWDGALWKVAEINVVLGKIKLAAEDGRVVQLASSAFEKAEGRWVVKAGAAVN
jgi:cell fate regulator YaaT (PSP1 superfamily)